MMETLQFFPGDIREDAFVDGDVSTPDVGNIPLLKNSVNDANFMEIENLLNDGQFLPCQPENGVNDVDEPEDNSKLNYLEHNQKHEDQLHIILEAVQEALDKNLSRQDQIDEELMDLPVIVEPSTPQQHVSVSKKSLTVFCAPYFKNQRLYSHPKNPDTIKKEENKELDVYASNPAKWTDSHGKRLKLKVRENALMKNVEYSEWIRVKEILIQERNKKRLSDDEMQDLTIQIIWADNEAKKIAELCEDHLFKNKTEDFDWDKISLDEFPRVHSAKSCELQWKNRIHPSWNQTAWSRNEDELLKVLADITDETDWDFIAEELETDRTPISCMERLMRKLNKADSKRSWDTDEDEYLVKLVGEHRINNLIPWSKIACHMDRRGKDQCYQRYIYSLRDGFTRGSFTEKEDMLLLAAVEMHGEDWPKVGSYFHHRTPAQLFSRWKAFLKADFKNWTQEEDEKLMDLVEKLGEKNWQKVSTEMSSGGRTISNTQVRQRYTFVKAKYENLEESQGKEKLKYKDAPGLSSVRQAQIYKKTREEFDNWSEIYEMETDQEEDEEVDLEKDAKRSFLELFSDVDNQKLESFMRHVQGLIALSVENSNINENPERISENSDASKFGMPPLSVEDANQITLASELMSSIGDFPHMKIMSSESSIPKETRYSIKETTKKINPRWRRFGEFATCGDVHGAEAQSNPENPSKMTLIPPNRATVTGYRELLLNHMHFERLTLAEFLRVEPENEPPNVESDCEEAPANVDSVEESGTAALSPEEAPASVDSVKESVCDTLSPEEADDLLSRRFLQLFLLPAKMAVIEPGLSICPELADVGVVEPDTESELSNDEGVEPGLSDGEVVAPAEVPAADSMVSQSWVASVVMSNAEGHTPDPMSAAAESLMSNAEVHTPDPMSAAALSSGDVSMLLEPEVSDEQKLLSRCTRQQIVGFEDVYSENVMSASRKVGEGAFGEVFLIGCDGPAKLVLKVVPVGGNVDVNDEPQTSLEEMLSEVVISKSLSCLRSGLSNQTDGFVEVRQCHLLKGEYPRKLLELWDHFDEEKTSENYRPDYLPSHQLFIALELNNGGRDLEKFEFSNASQALAAWRQVIHTVACAEEELEFEHRDLHWGNVLIKETKDTVVHFNLGGDTFQVATQGVLITIIDFSLSRLTSQEDGVTIFKDLSTDTTIFMGKGKDKKGGDYQFDIYRKMKQEIGNDWKKFCPKTNILWMHYMLDKMSAPNGVHYKGKKTAKAHRSGIGSINGLKRRLIEDIDSATMFVRREGDRVN